MFTRKKKSISIGQDKLQNFLDRELVRIDRADGVVSGTEVEVVCGDHKYTSLIVYQSPFFYLQKKWKEGDSSLTEYELERIRGVYPKDYSK